MDTASIGIAEEEEEEQGVDEEYIFYGMVFFLAAITRGLFSRVLGADNASFRPVMGKRGEAGVATGVGSSSNELTTEAASASVAPSRWARAARERAGASPRVRRAANSAGRRTCIHCLAVLCLILKRRHW